MLHNNFLTTAALMNEIMHSNRTVPSQSLRSPPLTLTALDMAKIVGNPHVLIHFGKKKR